VASELYLDEWAGSWVVAGQLTSILFRSVGDMCLFFHRRLRCLLIVDLKGGKFGYADAGQMHLYLNYAR
jgi:hypothetical protein